MVNEELSDKDLQFDIDGSISQFKKDNFTVVIPVLNEEKGIGSVIEKVKNEGYKNILVVDGNSTDETVFIALKCGVEVINQHGVGKTSAIRTAVEYIRTPYFIIMDGDCTYDPKDIKNFFIHMQRNDEVIGFRTFGKNNIPVLNRFGNMVLNLVFNIIFGTDLVDVCSGMYALKTNFARKLNLETTGFDVEVEIAAKVARRGRIAQVPINYYRRVGQQKLKPLKHGMQIFASIIRLSKSNF